MSKACLGARIPHLVICIYSSNDCRSSSHVNTRVYENASFPSQVQYDVVRSFQEQREELRGLLREYAVNETLAQEVERLRAENERLRRHF